MEALHPWDLEPAEAMRVQAGLRERLDLRWDGREIRTVAGVDIGLGVGTARAAIVVLRYPSLAPVEAVVREVELTFPYIPGLLSFREGPAFLAAWERLSELPDLVMFDGQGIAHPRGVGIAAQMGLWIERPTIGVAKSFLYGRYEPVGPQRGDRSPLRDPKDPERVIGMVLRSKDNTKPLYVSPGHRIDVERAVEFVLGCCTRYRLPETTRWAHMVAGGAELPKTLL